jgi:hypothetical protein
MVRRRKAVVGDSAAIDEVFGDDAVAAVVDASGDDDSAHDGERSVRRPDLRPGVAWGNLVTDTLKIGNPATLAQRLRDELTLGDERVSYGSVVAALDRSAANLDAAGRLHRAARVEEARFELECAGRVGLLRSTAQDQLMAEYKEKRRRSPTNDDIEERVLSMWPDEYSSIKRRISELHAATRSLETLRDAWASRCADLRIMAQRAAQER